MKTSLPYVILIAAAICMVNELPLDAQTTDSGAALSANNLMPVPAHLEARTGSLNLDTSFSVCTNLPKDARLQDGVRRFLTTMGTATDLTIELHTDCSASHATLQIDVRSAGQVVQSEDEDESYSVDVETDGMHLNAASTVGALRGMETLLQLIQPLSGRWVIPAVHIDDEPRFRWRGFMLDVSRHFQSVGEIKRTLDGMAAVKMNVFHWHLTDDQGFRVESKRYPRLTSMGSNGEFYTQEQIREIVAYARARGIRVLPEFDMPGHSNSWFVGYPKLATRKGVYSVAPGIKIANAAMDPTLESTYGFIDSFISEMTTLFPDRYIHIGGDETDGTDWRANPRVAAFMKSHNMKDAKDLQAYFNVRIQKILAHHNRRMMGWDEILHSDLPKTVMVQTWRGPQYIAESVAAGHTAIFSAKNAYYLDHMVTAEEMYLNDPIPADAKLTDEQNKLVLGGEVCMWGEQVNERTVDSRTWPRTAAVAERLWSPQNVRNVGDMYRRLNQESIRLEALGLTHITMEEAGLRELASSQDDSSLKVFASVTQPVDLYRRNRLEHPTNLMPFNSLVDSINPDPPQRYRFVQTVKSFLATKSNSYEMILQREFSEWSTASANLHEQAKTIPALAAESQRFDELSTLGSIGEQAIGFINSGKPAPADWVKSSEGKVAQIGARKSLIDFVVLDALNSMVVATSQEAR